MKNPPTLADACIATALDKRMAAKSGTDNAEIRGLLLKIAHARKFVLDSEMSAYLCDLSKSFWRGGLRKRIAMLENARHMARVPHGLCWFEFDYHAFIERAKTKYGMMIKRPPGVSDNHPFAARVGWLLSGNPRNEAAFTATEIKSSLIIPNRVFTHPVSIGWCSDDSPLPWHRYQLYKDEEDDVVDGKPYVNLHTMMPDYRCPYVTWLPTFSERLSMKLINAVEKTCANGNWFRKPDMPIKDLWALLATINDLPIKIEHIEPSKGYVARGTYKRFLTHSIIHLTVPETRWYKLVRKAATILRRRAHQVRGHWRIDWRQRPVKTCDHIWNERMHCSKCGGHMFWIAEHQRGDASMGFVTHDYEVSHEREAAE